MKIIWKLIAATAAGYLAAALVAQVKTPTSEEAKVTCLTLERLLASAIDSRDGADAAALSRAYKVAFKYVGDTSSLHDASDYVADFDRKNISLLAAYSRIKGGFKNRPFDDFALFSANDEHRSAVIFFDKNDNFQVLHSNFDIDALSKTLMDGGKAISISHGSIK